ncbi:ribbon-helix-helix domain-containing protein [Nocardia jiangsuensis]|uniref:CopG family transcriptional regulator n=1 Tax=Nocardia jiangsuensis TaxID=1691563 RepID=A0ABV8DLS2_9NOCA
MSSYSDDIFTGDPDAVLGSLTFEDGASTPALPPTAQEAERGMVTRSLKMPPAMDAAIKSASADRGITPSALIRELIAAGLAQGANPGRLVPIDAVIEAVTNLPVQNLKSA